MADNVAITAGSGTSILTDDCTTGHAQIVKLAIATDGSATLIPADSGGLLVNLGTNNDVTASQTGTWTVQPGNTANTTAWLTTEIPNQYDLATAATAHVKKYYTSAGAATDGIVWSPAAGKRWYVTDMIINVSAAATVTLEDDLTAGDSPVFKAELAANSGIAHSFKTPLYSGEDAADLLITTSAGNVYVTVTGYEI